MSSLYTVHCLKCHQAYQDQEPDDFYCPGCNQKRKEIARQVNAKLARQPKVTTPSLLAEYDAAPKIGGFMIVK